MRRSSPTCGGVSRVPATSFSPKDAGLRRLERIGAMTVAAMLRRGHRPVRALADRPSERDAFSSNRHHAPSSRRQHDHALVPPDRPTWGPRSCPDHVQGCNLAHGLGPGRHFSVSACNFQAETTAGGHGNCSAWCRASASGDLPNQEDQSPDRQPLHTVRPGSIHASSSSRVPPLVSESCLANGRRNKWPVPGP